VCLMTTSAAVRSSPSCPIAGDAKTGGSSSCGSSSHERSYPSSTAKVTAGPRLQPNFGVAAAALGLAGATAYGLTSSNGGGSTLHCEGIESETQLALKKPPSAGEHFLNVQGLSGHVLRNRMVTVFIGLPLRGKSHMARRLKRYLEFFHGFEVEIFDVNEYSGKEGNAQLLEALKEFFERDGGGEQRRSDKYVRSGRFAILCASDTNEARTSKWSGHSKWRRRWMSQQLENELQAQTIFVEIQVTDTSTHRHEYMDHLERIRGYEPGALAAKIADYEKDYVTIQSDDGTEDDLQYMKLVNYNHKVVNNRMMRSFIGSRIAQFLTSVHPYKRTIYLTRHGESVYNVQKKLGGDSGLSPLGREYAPRLAEFSEYVIGRGSKKFACFTISSKENKADKLRNNLTRIPRGGQTGGIFAKGDWGAGVQEGMQLVRIQRGYGSPFEDAPASIEEVVQMASSPGPLVLVFVDDFGEEQEVPARLWTSSLRRTKETAAHIRHPELKQPSGKVWTQMAHGIYRSLDEVYAGEFEGLTYEEIKTLAPEEAKLRKVDKLGYRYPRGESYYDVIARLDLPLSQLESYREPTMIIGHQAVHRMVYAFLTGVKREHCTEIAIPLHTVIKLEFDGTGAMKETRYFLGPRRLDEDDGQSQF